MTEPKKPAATELEVRYANAIDSTVAVIQANIDRLAAKKDLTAQDGAVVLALSQSIAALHRGAIWSARTIRGRQK